MGFKVLVCQMLYLSIRVLVTKAQNEFATDSSYKLPSDLGGFQSEEEKRATTNVLNGLVFFFLFSFILFSSL